MIELYDGYCITVDAYGYTLSKHTLRFDKKTGKETLSPQAYCSTLEHALETFVNLKIKTELQNDTYTVGEALAVIQHENHRLQEFLKVSLPSYKVVEER